MFKLNRTTTAHQI